MCHWICIPHIFQLKRCICARQAFLLGDPCRHLPRQAEAALVRRAVCTTLCKRKSKTGTERRYQVSGKYRRKRTKTREGLGFQERQAVISKCFFALSACLTKAAGELYWRIRLVAFLWLLTSGGFGLCLESQWSNGHVWRFVKRSIDCGLGNNAFFSPFKAGLFMLWLIILHLWLQFDVFYSCEHLEALLKNVWGFTWWAHGRRRTCFLYSFIQKKKKSAAKFLAVCLTKHSFTIVHYLSLCIRRVIFHFVLF